MPHANQRLRELSINPLTRARPDTASHVQFADNVLGNGSNFADAYWEIRYIRTYLAEGATAVQSNATTPSTTADVTSASAVWSTQTVTATSSAASSAGTGSGSSGNTSPTSAAASTSAPQASQLFLALITATSMLWFAFC